MTDDCVTWRSVFDSVRGTAHVEDGAPCQDACRVIQVGPVLIAVCSDGAGSASYADVGSKLVCDTFASLAAGFIESGSNPSEITREIALDWCKAIREAVVNRADELQVSTRELACTLIGALIGGAHAAFLQIGDGAMVIDSGVSHEAVFWPQSGEYANTTNFVTGDDLEDVLEFYVHEASISEFAAFTDGMERLILRFADKAVHSPSLSPMFEALRLTDDVEGLFEALRDFLNSERVNCRTNDDKTLILAVREGGQFDATEVS